MIEVFKTGIQKKPQARQVMLILSKDFPSCKFNIDLDDGDRILRVEGPAIRAEEIIRSLNAGGYACEMLDD